MSSADEKAIVETLTAFIGCVKSKDYAKMHTYINPTGHAALRRNGTGDIIPMTLPELIDSLDKIIEEMFPDCKEFDETFDDPEVRVNKDLATVFSSCRLLADGKLVGEGNNVFSLHKMDDGRWKVSAVVDRMALVGSPAEA